MSYSHEMLQDGRRFSHARFSAYARDLADAVYELRREQRQMSISDVRNALRDIPGADGMSMSYAPDGNQVFTIGDRSVEVGPMASNEEIRAAIVNPFIQTRATSMSITGYEPGSIRDRLAALKEHGRQRREQAIAKLDQAGKKHDQVSAEIEKVADQIEKEADDALAEFAQFSNGAPD